MKSYEAAIEQAIATAPVVNVTAGASDLDGYAFYSYYQKIGDLQHIDGTRHLAALDGEPVPGRVYVNSISELDNLMRDYGVSTNYRLHALDHEADHGNAHDFARATRIGYGLKFVKEINDETSTECLSYRAFTHAERFWSRKLEVAAAAAHPFEPSDGDMAIIEKLGYEGVEEVGYRAVMYNRELKEPIAVPLSYTPAPKIFDMKHFRIRKAHLADKISRL